MTDFWSDFEGNKIDGTKGNVDTSWFDTIPGGTKALALIESAEHRNSDQWGQSYQVKWRLIDGDFKNRVVFQSVKAFDSDPKKAGRAKHMLMKLFQLSGKSAPESAPTTPEMMQLAGTQAGITLDIWETDDGQNDGNWVSVLDIPTGFQCVTGTRKPKGQAAPAPAAANDSFGDDIPF